MNKEDQLFLTVIGIFSMSAMQGLGKIKNPVTNKIERNLEQAKQSIEILEMLRTKTEGNLSQELKRALESSLSELKLNYVDELNKN